MFGTQSKVGEGRDREIGEWGSEAEAKAGMMVVKGREVIKGPIKLGRNYIQLRRGTNKTKQHV